MSSASEVISKLMHHGVTVRVDGEELVLAPAAKVPHELIPTLQRLKPAIMALLRNGSASGFHNPKGGGYRMKNRGKAMENNGANEQSYYMQELVRSPEGKAILREQLESALPPRAAAKMLAVIPRAHLERCEPYSKVLFPCLHKPCRTVFCHWLSFPS